MKRVQALGRSPNSLGKERKTQDISAAATAADAFGNLIHAHFTLGAHGCGVRTQKSPTMVCLVVDTDTRRRACGKEPVDGYPSQKLILCAAIVVCPVMQLLHYPR